MHTTKRIILKMKLLFTYLPERVKSNFILSKNCAWVGISYIVASLTLTLRDLKTFAATPTAFNTLGNPVYGIP